MSVLKTAWANLQDGLGNRFSWSHVKAIFYNYAEQKLLSTKLDEMDALIDEKIAKAMMSNVQVNDQTKVPTSALAYSMSQDISQNAQDITQLYSKFILSGDAVSVRIYNEGDSLIALNLTYANGEQYSIVLLQNRIQLNHYAGSEWTAVWSLPTTS